MSLSSLEHNERRLSVNGRNAYLTVNAEERDISKNKKQFDDSAFLTAKPINRARSCSPALFVNNCVTTTAHLSPTAVKANTLINTTENINMPKSMPNVTNEVSKKTNTKTGTLPKPAQCDEITQKSPVQMGIDRYITVLKRGRSPNSSKVASNSKVLKDNGYNRPNSENRFAILDNEINDAPIIKSFRPPPIYLREQNSSKLVKDLISLIGENSFFVVPFKRGNINETKIQVNHENDYRKIITDFESRKRSFYTYQLKSSKGLQIVIKGVDSCVEPQEIKSSLETKGFKIKNVINIKNREKIPQPLFRVELEPGDIKLKKGETHPIYDLKYLLHRRITVEEPHKRSGPVQCLNCQEYGHTRSYCKLPPVCVACGELHCSSQCDKPRNDSNIKKCSNCAGNHTANYRGCPVYSIVKSSLTLRNKVPMVQVPNVRNVACPQYEEPTTKNISYANVLKSNQNVQNPLPNNNVNMEPNNQTPSFNFSRLEATVETLVQSVNNFTNSMSNMMQEMLKMQSMLLQAVLNKP